MIRVAKQISRGRGALATLYDSGSTDLPEQRGVAFRGPVALRVAPAVVRPYSSRNP